MGGGRGKGSARSQERTITRARFLAIHGRWRRWVGGVWSVEGRVLVGVGVVGPLRGILYAWRLATDEVPISHIATSRGGE